MATRKLNKVVFLFVAIIFAASAANDEELWREFKSLYFKNYKSLMEEKLRQEIFRSNLKNIEEHNIKYETGKSTYYMGINKFADLTDEEFEKYYLTYDESQEDEPLNKFVLPSNIGVPDSIDWRETGAVLPVKDQGHCGSCWAFSATGALEGQNAIQHDKYVPLSEQELIDCSDTNHGCSGGNMVRTFKFLANFTVYTEDSYPYRGENGTCKEGKDAKVKVVDYVKVTSNEKSLKEAVGTIGPVSISINGKGIKSYLGGIFDNPDCNQKLNHAVLAVGYGTKSGLDYWIVKNSWGSKWGEDGYIYMSRNKNQQCGISLRNSYPVIA